MEYLLENPHEDLLKKVHKILAFLARNDRVTNEQLEMIWKCMGQQEVIRAALCDALASAIVAFSQAQVDLLLDKISKFPRSEFRPALVKLLSEIPTRRKDRTETPQVQQGVQDRVADFLWALIQENSDVKIDIVKQSIEELKKVVRGRRLDFVRRCVHTAMTGSTVIPSLLVAQGLLGTLSSRQHTHTHTPHAYSQSLARHLQGGRGRASRAGHLDHEPRARLCRQAPRRPRRVPQARAAQGGDRAPRGGDGHHL